MFGTIEEALDFYRNEVKSYVSWCKIYEIKEPFGYQIQIVGQSEKLRELDSMAKGLGLTDVEIKSINEESVL